MDGFARVDGRSMKTRLGLSMRSSWNGTSASSSITILTTSGRMARRIALMLTSFDETAGAAIVPDAPFTSDDVAAGTGDAEGGTRDAAETAAVDAAAAEWCGSEATAAAGVST